MDTLFVIFLILDTCISFWKIASSALLITCFVKNRRNKWPWFATNIFAGTLSSMSQGVVGMGKAAIEIMENVNGLGGIFCAVVDIVFMVLITYGSFEMLSILIQMSITFNRPAIKITSTVIALVNVVTLAIVSVIIAVPVALNAEIESDYFEDHSNNMTYNDNNGEDKLVALFGDDNFVFNYFTIVNGTPVILSLIIFSILFVVARKGLGVVSPAAAAENSEKSIPTHVKIATTSGQQNQRIGCRKEAIAIKDEETNASFDQGMRVQDVDSISFQQNEYINDNYHGEPNKTIILTCADIPIVTVRKPNVQNIAMKTLGCCLLANSVIPLACIAMMLAKGLMGNESAELGKTITFLLLHLNTSFSFIILVKQYPVIRNALKYMIQEWINNTRSLGMH